MTSSGARPPLTPLSAPALALIGANLVPLAGVLFFGWDVGDIFALYWLESAVVGVATVLRFLALPDEQGRLAVRIARALFFTVHFGIFMFVHGMLIVTVFVDGDTQGAPGMPAPTPLPLVHRVLTTGGVFGLVALVCSHGFSFVRSFLIGGERHRWTLNRVMSAPYRRILAMHLTLLLGGFLTMAIGTSLPVLGLLVAAKTVADLKAHRSEHSAAAAAVGEARDEVAVD